MGVSRTCGSVQRLAHKPPCHKPPLQLVPKPRTHCKVRRHRAASVCLQSYKSDHCKSKHTTVVLLVLAQAEMLVLQALLVAMHKPQATKTA